MDKYEFNIKVEQIKKLVSKKDYETAMKIADTIDWRRVRSANLLSSVADIYENNGEYQEAKEILLLAFERAPIGKRLLYKLAELALREGSVKEAEDYYREFCDLAPDDPRQYLLRYLILKAKKAPEEQLIHSLERYTDTELDEKWMYELAELYGKAGQQEECVKTCDRIMLMFGLGKYVDKAMELKVKYAPLTGYQKDLIENRDKYEEKLRAVEQEFSDDSQDSVLEDYEEEEPMPEPDDALYRTMDEELTASLHQAETEERLAKEMSKISIEEYHEPESDIDQTKVIGNIRDHMSVHAEKTADVPEPEVVGKPEEEMAETAVEPEAESAAEEPEAEEPKAEEPKAEEPKAEEPKAEEPKVRGPKAAKTAETEEPKVKVEEAEEPVIQAKPEQGENAVIHHIIIEARTPEKGLETAVKALKQIREETGRKNPVVKISGSRLNERGVFASADKLNGKDLIIEEAGDLEEDALEELRELMTKDHTGMQVVLIDNPRQVESLGHINPGLIAMFLLIGLDGSGKPEVKTQPEEEGDVDASCVLPEEDNSAPAVEPDMEPDEETSDPDEELEIQEFVEYACKYAKDIDCSITGKSMLALYERIEIMEEDGVSLTRVNAEDLIEEAADRAEKPSITKVFTGLFSPKYDKEGLLVLREEHFID